MQRAGTADPTGDLSVPPSAMITPDTASLPVITP
jgi:hypothetical protein